MTMNFEEAFKGGNGRKGINDINPDSRLPKINEPEDPAKGKNGKDGKYTICVTRTEGFHTQDPPGLSIKVEVRVEECDNGRLKPDTVASLMFHGLVDPTPWMAEKNIGNLKDFLAAAFSSAQSKDIAATDPSCDGDPWDKVAVAVAKDPDILVGARLICQVFTDTSKGKRPGSGGVPSKFARVKYTPLKAAFPAT